jgi:hypothetical protein
MNNLIIIALHAVIAVFIVIPMFLILFGLKFLKVTYYAIKHHVLGFEMAHPPIAH